MKSLRAIRGGALNPMAAKTKEALCDFRKISRRRISGFHRDHSDQPHLGRSMTQ